MTARLKGVPCHDDLVNIPDPSARRRMLIEAVLVVAAAASAQMAWLEKHGVPPDEIALGFDDVFRLAGQLVEEGQLSPAVLPRLQMIDQVFGEIGQDSGADRWTRAAMSTDARWDSARQLAREVLAAESERDAPPPDICIVR
ncbi:hypothetical protein [Streptomyces sp. NBC_00347]|uniref:hypothetical protein n=1 Tax=Streptomyces sp. NBC_00347 TaxID=2975721 RepID=UPI002250387F|nr:hypothetical protein [Streptomyces sp. NBC_00347]MCX5130005.1 hypothetical protein [Streptomyces sp. NBC_00347]